jgi:prepilin-type N-terminal cleavage/methylation domain-containing protein
MILQKHKTPLSSQAGFTLVELAIVMIIIGLLIGGVLKGQQLITNAQVTAQVAQIKGIDAAVTSFQDMYNALPGDMLNPAGRLPNCNAAPCNQPGDGNGSLTNTPSVLPLATNEGGVFFIHMAAADLLTGVNVTAAFSTLGWDISLPASKISGGGLFAGSSTGAGTDFAGAISAVGAAGGLWLTLEGPTPVVPAAGAGQFLTPNLAQRLDTKIDDGAPGVGSVRAFGSVGVGAGNCGTAAAYTEVNQTKACGLFIRIQG